MELCSLSMVRLASLMQTPILHLSVDQNVSFSNQLLCQASVWAPQGWLTQRREGAKFIGWEFLGELCALACDNMPELSQRADRFTTNDCN